jgi:hypothetical protein
MLKLKGSLTHRPGVKVCLPQIVEADYILTIDRLREQDACTALMDVVVAVSIRRLPMRLLEENVYDNDMRYPMIDLRAKIGIGLCSL